MHVQRLPPNTLNLAAVLEIWASHATGFRVVSLILNVFADPNPMPTTNIRIRVENQSESKIKRRHVSEINAAMRATRFVGTLTLDSLRNPFEANVQLGHFEVAPGKGICLRHIS